MVVTDHIRAQAVRVRSLIIILQMNFGYRYHSIHISEVAEKAHLCIN
jgi:hypothetical protein